MGGSVVLLLSQCDSDCIKYTNATALRRKEGGAATL